MKHKTTMLKCLFLLIFIGGINLAANSQPPYVKLNTGDGNKLSIIVAPVATIRSFSDTSTAIWPRKDYSIWLEKGDGNYLSTFSNETEDIPAGNLNTFPYLLASRLYEPRKRPPTSASLANRGTQSGEQATMSSPQLEISGGKIKLFSNVGEIVANDTMVFGISYIPDTLLSFKPLKYKVIFRYNSGGQYAFNAITTPTSGSGIFDYIAGEQYILPYIRNYNKERVLVATNTVELGNFSNAIVFDSITNSKNTSNIFISLVPVNDLPETSDIEAELLYQDGTTEDWKRIGISEIDNMERDFAHDPNSISVFPRCLSLPQTKQNLHYTINFQNTGGGDADAVKIAFYFPLQMNRSKLIRNLKASYSDIANYPLTDIVYDWINGRIIFTIKKINDEVLEGTRVPFPVTNPKTMGQISFDLEIEPGTDVNQSAIIDAWAEIYLHGVYRSPFAITSEMISNGIYIPNTEGFEMPVRTQNAVTLFSNCCTDKPACKCSEPKGIWQWLCCYWWIIAIILLIFVIWWLYKRLRRHS